MEYEKYTFIIRCGEIALKGMNKPYFERLLLERIKRALKEYKDISAHRSEGLIFVYASIENDKSSLIRTISQVFGVASVSDACETESDIDVIGKHAVEYMKDMISSKGIKTFKVEAKRADKSFPIQSPDISRRIGAAVLKGCGVLKVDVHEPDCVLFVNVRREHSYIYADKIKGLILLSGGIDSPVAAWMMAKRGMMIEAVHFHSYPYTSERAREKVYDLTRILASYCGRIKVHSINLLEIQQAIGENCPTEEMTILSRRFMMKIAERIAKKYDCDMLITGENIGQVASQTVKGLVVTDAAVNIPVMRPLIAFDKVDIMAKAQEIGTYETSIQPYEDCCTIFLPKHPVTRPKLSKILESEALLNEEALIDSALETMETVSINFE